MSLKRHSQPPVTIRHESTIDQIDPYTNLHLILFALFLSLCLDLLHNRFNNILPRNHGSITSITARQILRHWAQHLEPTVLAAPVLLEHAHLRRRDGMVPHACVHGRSHEDLLLLAVDGSCGVPGANHARQKVVAHAVDDLGQGVCAQWCNHKDVCPSSQLYVQDWGVALPWLSPLRGVSVEGVDIGQVSELVHCGLLNCQTGEKLGRRLCEDDADRNIRLRFETLDDLNELYRRDRPRGGEEDMALAIIPGLFEGFG